MVEKHIHNGYNIISIFLLKRKLLEQLYSNIDALQFDNCRASCVISSCVIKPSIYEIKSSLDISRIDVNLNIGTKINHNKVYVAFNKNDRIKYPDINLSGIKFFVDGDTLKYTADDDTKEILNLKTPIKHNIISADFDGSSYPIHTSIDMLNKSYNISIESIIESIKNELETTLNPLYNLILNLHSWNVIHSKMLDINKFLKKDRKLENNFNIHAIINSITENQYLLKNTDLQNIVKNYESTFNCSLNYYDVANLAILGEYDRILMRYYNEHKAF